MAHEVETMFYRNDVPWHRLGTRVIEEPSVEEAMIAAQLNWTVETKPLFLEDGTQAPSNAVVRTTDNSILGVVSPNYTPLQNIDAFNFFNRFIDSKQAVFETAGSLKGGKRVWILAKINNDPMVIGNDDTVEKYVLLAHGHDGTMSVRTGFTPIRVVCANTLAMSVNNASSKLIRLKHTKNLKENLERVSEIMNLANQEFEATAEQYRFLTNRSVNQSDLEKYVKLVFVGKNYKQLENEGKNPARDIMPKIVRLFEEGTGSNLQTAKGTFWGAYNAVNEYLGYERGSDDAARLDKMWFGDGANLNHKALDIAIKLAA